jgi:hypothetical protein
VLTDSLVSKQTGGVGPDGKPLTSGGPGSNGMNTSDMNQSSGMNANPGNGTDSSATDPNQPPQVNQAVKARPSDRLMGLQPGGQPSTDSSQPGQNPYGSPPSQPGLDPQSPYPGQGSNPQTQGTSQTQATASQPGVTGSFVQPGGSFGGSDPSQAGSASGAGGTGAGQSGPTSAAQLINNLLTQPRQFPGTSSIMGSNSASIGAGIAGVATKYKSPAIKIYKERKKYQEWEFVYDPKEEAAKQLGTQAAGQNPGNTGPTGTGPGQTGSSGFSSGFTSFSQPGSQGGSAQPASAQPSQ